MIFEIDIKGCRNCPFHDSEWGCNLLESGLSGLIECKECPFETESIVVIENKRKENKK